MSRGLSAQQRAILGMGVRINRAANGGKVVPIAGTRAHHPYYGPVLYAPGLAEVTVRYALHLLDGVPVVGVCESGPYAGFHYGLAGFFGHTPHTRSRWLGIARAVRSLVE